MSINGLVRPNYSALALEVKGERRTQSFLDYEDEDFEDLRG
jgi:hypothetical protein